VADVAGNEYKIMVYSSSSNEKIRISYKLALLTQVASDMSEAAHDGPCKGQDRYSTKEPVEIPLMHIRVEAEVNSFEDFSIRY